MLTAMFFSFFHASDVISPSKASTRNIKKLEERKTDPLSLEGYGGPTPQQRAPEKGKGGCWAEPGVPGHPGRAKVGAGLSPECQAPREGRGGCWAEPGVPGPPGRAKVGAGLSPEFWVP